MYKEPEYANSRLYNTIVRLGNTPAYIQQVHGDMSCTIYKGCMEAEPERVLLDDLNLLSPPLGYVNHKGRAHYISRKPMRRDWRQGVRPCQLAVLVDTRVTVTNNLVMKCIQGVFPTLNEALLGIEDGAVGVALSRAVAIVKTRSGVMSVRYRWYKVGIVKDGSIVLAAKHKYLSKLMEAYND